MIKFISQVKQEISKVTWPGRSETLGMSLAVAIMVICAMLYFACSDFIAYEALNKIVGLYRG